VPGVQPEGLALLELIRTGQCVGVDGGVVHFRIRT
jgi:hypothetical protein